MFFLRFRVRACVDVFARCRRNIQVTVVAVERIHACYMFVYLCMYVCVHGSAVWCSLIPVDAVIWEDVAVYVSTLQDKNMFRDSATAVCHSFYHHWSSGDRMHKGFIAKVMVSINHIYSIALHQIGCDLIPQDFVYATHTQMHVCLWLYINGGWMD